MKEEIAEVVGFELEDPRVQNVTVTEVKVSDDIRDAKVYVIVDGSPEEVDKAMVTLQRAAAFVRQQVSLNLSLRFAPHLHFVRDTAEENAARVGELLRGLSIPDEKEDRTDDEG